MNSDEIRSKRKQLIALLREQQEHDANHAQQIKTMVTDSHRKLLNPIVELLEHMRTEDKVYRDVVNVVRLITPQFNPSRWIEEVSKRHSCSSNLSLAKVKAAAAADVYERHSPFGFIDRFFQDDIKKTESLRLKKASDYASEQVTSAQRQLDVQDSELRKLAEVLLRAATSQEGLLALSRHESPVQKSIKNELESFNQEFLQTLSEHSQRQSASLADCQKLITDLKEGYPRANLPAMRQI